jgi:hypothetical protein
MALDWASELTHSSITAIVALLASFFGAKWAESRKLQARFEKLDHIREEMREVTRVQEQIKRQLQGGEWNRQTLWKQRLDAYTQLLRTGTDFLDRCYGLLNRMNGEAGDGQELRTQLTELQKARAEMFKAVTVVEIFGDPAILDALRAFFLDMQETRGGETSAENVSQEIAAVAQLQTVFVEAARSQLNSVLNQD